MSRLFKMVLVSIWVIVGLVAAWMILYYLDPFNVFPFFHPNVIVYQVSKVINYPFLRPITGIRPIALILAMIMLIWAGVCTTGLVFVTRSVFTK